MNAIARVLEESIGAPGNGLTPADRRRRVARFLDDNGARARQAHDQALTMAADARRRVEQLRDMIRGATGLGLTSTGFEHFALDFPAKKAADKHRLQHMAADIREQLADIDQIKHMWSQAWREVYAVWLDAVEAEAAAIDEAARGFSVLFARQLATEVRQRLAGTTIPDSASLLRLERDSA